MCESEKAAGRLVPIIAALLLHAFLPAAASAQATERVGDLVTTSGNVPRRLIGYSLVVGLDGTGDRNIGGLNGGTQTVRSIANALRRFGLEVPPDRLRPRNVAAVIVTAEISPWLRSGGRFEVQVSSIGDAVSLRGGVLWTTPLLTDVDQAPIATAQGPVLVPDEDVRYAARRGNAARIPEGGLLEVDPAQLAAVSSKLLLKHPSLATAQRIAAAINAGLGDSTVAKVDDPGSITLNPGSRGADNLIGFLASVDTLPVRMVPDARVVIDARSGTVVSGGTIHVAAATVSHRGMTLRIGGPPPATPAPGDTLPKKEPEGLLAVGEGATVQEVAAGLHAAGARPQEIAAMFSALREVGAIGADVVVR
ncbi:MAG TPA: flagellar basal body P-ring protein FlgI [Gemmatimonadales bacterium]|nr:flagellar basal body P-ring protein FlgI [Gemmatimonadales bacterium]